MIRGATLQFRNGGYCKARLVVMLAIAILACSQRSFAHTNPYPDVKSQARADSAAFAAKQVTLAAQGDPRRSRDNETVIVDLPFPSLEIDPSWAEYPSLTSKQVRAIRHLVSQERRELEPLMKQLQSTHEKLLAMADQGQSKETEVLVAMEARILIKLFIKSTHIQARRRNLLTREQQMKLEDLKRSR
jgi:hypothetical protein